MGLIQSCGQRCMREPDVGKVIAVFAFLEMWQHDLVERFVYVCKVIVFLGFEEKDLLIEVAECGEPDCAGSLCFGKVVYKLEQLWFVLFVCVKGADCYVRRDFVVQHKGVACKIGNFFCCG